MIKHLLGGLWGGGGAPSAVLAVPEGERVYAVGDIHGHDALLERLLDMIAADAKGYKGAVALVFVGDYIDRGPASREVLDRLVARGWPAAWQAVFLRGNHEQALLDFLDDPEGRPDWLSWGGVEALASYGVKLFSSEGRQRSVASLAAELEGVLEENGHLAFLKATTHSHVAGGVLVVHAGVRPGVPLARQLESDLRFIREGFVGVPHGLPYRVVHGHTIVPEVVVADDRVSIDTGAYEGGGLSAVALERDGVRVLQVK